MNEVWTMMLKGVGAGAWVVGAGLALVVALPVFWALLGLIGWALRGGKRKDDDL